MLKVKVKISSKGQIVIPKKIRDRLKSDILDMEMEGDEIKIRPSKSVVELAGSLKEYGKNGGDKMEKLFFNICAKVDSLTSPIRGLPKVAVTTDSANWLFSLSVVTRKINLKQGVLN